MKIWHVIENDHQVRFYWFSTKREALAHKREYDADGVGSCEIEKLTVRTNRAGIVSALNHVISLTCFNEG
jgi:hypothetical protein